MEKKLRKITVMIATLTTMVFWSSRLLHPAEMKPSRGLNYTFIGPAVGSGLNFLQINDWVIDRRKTEDLRGYYGSLGADLSIFASNIIGDFVVRYMHNANENYNLQHLACSISGKYSWKLRTNLYIAAGLGIYFESGPSNREYNGGSGGFIPAGLIYDLSFDSKVFLDLTAGYGVHGTGDESRKLSVGINAGYLIKVGRI